MYTPPYYRETDEKKIVHFLKENDFGTLTAVVNGRPVSSHLPFTLLNENPLRLEAHVSKANPLVQALKNGEEVLAQFLGTHHYISPRWYEKPNVPTWNYQAVHLYGKPRLIEDAVEKLAALQRLTERYEPNPNAYSLKNLPPDLMETDMRGILIFEITVTEIQAAFKLSQNRNDRDYANIIQELENLGTENARNVASAMRQNR